MIDDGQLPAQRRALLEWLAGDRVETLPATRLDAALDAGSADSPAAWLALAAEALGWEAELVDASPATVGGEPGSWWVACSETEPERWVVRSGGPGRTARAALIDTGPARDLSTKPARVASALGLSGPETSTRWVRINPSLPLESLRSPRDGARLSALRRLGRWVNLERRTIIAVIAYSTVIGGLSLAVPLAVQALVNSLAYGRVLQPLIVISIVLLGLLSLSAALRVLEVYIVELLQRRMFADVSRDLARRLPAARPGSGGPWGLTEKVNRFFDVVGAQKSASTLLLGATEIVMSTLAGLLVLAFYHPYLLVFDLVLLASLAFVLFWLGRGGIRTAVEESHAKYDLAAWLESMARAWRRFSTPEAAAWGVRRTDRLLVHWLHERSEHFRIVLRQTIGFAALQALASGFLLGLGAFLVWAGQLSLGQLVASELIITSVLGQLAKFGKHVETYYDLNASTDKIGMLIDMDDPRASGELLDSGGEALALDVRDLELPGGRISLAAEAGSRVALTGIPHDARRGLFDAVLGASSPQGGRVLLDGVPATALVPRQWRREVALLRDAEPVGATLEENLTSEAGSASSAELRRLLRDVGLGPRLESLKEGLRTWIYPDGAPFSPDDLVAFEVARTVLRKPRLVLVDRVLDAMDEERRAPVWRALTEQKWTLVVATNLPAVRDDCQHVLRWSNGALAEAGA